MIGDPDPIVLALTALPQQIEADAEDEILDRCMRRILERWATGDVVDDAAHPRGGTHGDRSFKNESHDPNDRADVEVAAGDFFLRCRINHNRLGRDQLR